MKTIGVFVDTSIVNRILKIDEEKINNSKYEEGKLYLSKIVEQYVKSDIVHLIVNPTVKQEIDNTKDPQKRNQLLSQFHQFLFTPYNKTIFPSFTLPAHLVAEEEDKTLRELCKDIPGFEKDKKIFADAVFNPEIDVLLTTDEKHLANDRLRSRLKNKGLDKKIKIFTPRQFFEYLQDVA